MLTSAEARIASPSRLRSCTRPLKSPDLSGVAMRT